MALGALVPKLLKSALKNIFKVDIALDKLMEKLNTACPETDKILPQINKLNKISSGLDQVKTMLSTVEKTTATAEVIVKTLKTAKPLLKFLPIPTSPVPIPVSVPIIAGDGLDSLKSLLNITDKTIDQIGLVFDVIIQAIDKVQPKINQIAAILSLCVQNALDNGELTEEQVQELSSAINQNTTNSSDEKEDKKQGEELLSSLTPNSLTPIIYRGFRLEEQPDDKNTFNKASRRRIVAYTTKNNILTLATDYSFASSTEVLVNECKFLIDRYLFEMGTN